MGNQKRVLITKADGNREFFDSYKLKRSLKKSGASAKAQDFILDHIQKELREGMTTGAIYKHAFELLRKEEKPSAARYSLKRAVLALGPSGFPFEDFITEIFKVKGYVVSKERILAGACAIHEVDLVASKDGECIVAELKFHNSLGVKTDLKVALYVQARLEDLKKSALQKPKKECITDGVLITNTKFTQNARSYGKCVGMRMISWSYPDNASLYSLIEETAVHPITCLTTLSNQNKKQLMEQKKVLCRDIKTDDEALKQLGLRHAKIKEIQEEAQLLCRPGTRF